MPLAQADGGRRFSETLLKVAAEMRPRSVAGRGQGFRHLGIPFVQDDEGCLHPLRAEQILKARPFGTQAAPQRRFGEGECGRGLGCRPGQVKPMPEQQAHCFGHRGLDIFGNETEGPLFAENEQDFKNPVVADLPRQRGGVRQRFRTMQDGRAQGRGEAGFAWVRLAAGELRPEPGRLDHEFPRETHEQGPIDAALQVRLVDHVDPCFRGQDEGIPRLVDPALRSGQDFLAPFDDDDEARIRQDKFADVLTSSGDEGGEDGGLPVIEGIARIAPRQDAQGSRDLLALARGG